MDIGLQGSEFDMGLKTSDLRPIFAQTYAVIPAKIRVARVGRT